jgi:hypothetical protein
LWGHLQGRHCRRQGSRMARRKPIIEIISVAN